MLCLDDDCLCLILRCLTLREQLIMTKVCSRFSDLIVECIWNTQYQNIYTSRPVDGATTKNLRAYDEVAVLNKDDYQAFYGLNIQNIRWLHIGNVSREAFCSYLGRFIQRPEFTFYFSFKYTKLIKLICLDKSLHDGHMRMITQNCPRLEILHVCSPYVTGKHLRNLHKLRHLNASNCNLKTEYLDEIIGTLKNLNWLDISGNSDLMVHISPIWDKILREYQIGDEQLFMKFYRQSDRDGLAVFADFDFLKRNWKEFFDYYAERVEILKIRFPAIRFLEKTAECSGVNFPKFPNMKELHLRESEHGNSLKSIVSSTKLHALYLYDNCNISNESLELVRSNADLCFIRISDVNDIEQICKFIENVQNILKILSDHVDISLHLLSTELQNSIHFRDELEKRLGADIFKYGSRLRVETYVADYQGFHNNVK